jgi:hypothetical protein
MGERVVKAQLINPEQAAELRAVDREQVYLWMSDDKVPYVDLQNGEFKLPLHGFLQCIPELCDLPGELRALDDAIAALPTEERARLQEGL